jgi:hypothetical protein
MRVYDYLVKFYDKSGDMALPPAAVITGQPGIGDSPYHLHLTYRYLSAQGRVSGCYMRYASAFLKSSPSSGTMTNQKVSYS